ncbi:alpha-amylase family glycosyl hydrolase [Paraflavisolibacter sp. H34]|uniref:alpha-amylase family glycosyl hydrolase n=1 Tax=Huijunlia imazamoxiresistens TaxID=3127457 RepID=UPI00301B22E0
MEQEAKALWWQTGIIYEVYLRSFQDSTGNGIGDLRGLLGRLDYLQWLGVTAVWVTPFYPSPMKDLGYDVSDYTGVDPAFGTMADMDELLAELHRRGMKLIIDFVPNHTSDQHAWFRESRSSRDNPKRDWYIWKDPKPGGGPPNNWLSVLGGSAWEWDESTGQYYYHAFLKEQPDLNYRNPEVMEAVLDAMRFWLDKGVDGVRIDVMWHMAKDEKFRDNPLNPDFKPEMPDCDRLLQLFSCDQPEVQELVARFRDLLDQYHERVMLGELYLPVHRILPYYGVGDKGAHLPGNFQMLLLPWTVDKLGIAVDQFEAALPDSAWPNWVLGNHDRPRLVDRAGVGQARVAALLLLTLRGTPILYYGDEIGMHNVDIPKEEWQDPQGLNMPDKNMSRDPQRTPMQWDSSENAGFTTGKPWLRMAEDARRNNVTAQQAEKDSLLCFYQRLIRLRQGEPALVLGDYYPVPTEDWSLLAYIRQKEGSVAFLVVLNLTDKPVTFCPQDGRVQGTVVLSTCNGSTAPQLKSGTVLRPHEGLLARLEQGGPLG